jgi:probable rRNA maturation factor
MDKRRPQVFVHNLQRAAKVDLARLEGSAVEILRSVLRTRPGRRTQLRQLREISVWLISDRRIARLHREFLGQPGPTDVLTFQHGEIFISTDRARRHARIFGNSLRRELELYIAHGLLHLHGFNDRQKNDARKMELLQERILKRVSNLN